ncbi:hypothetical protein D782_2531 [Enterobacteriaceae bacterium strain FGI 57]|nr:hypothetical protein D782_2531 [Enterobacteriaceae bacterium strain FGI 57]
MNNTQLNERLRSQEDKNNSDKWRIHVQSPAQTIATILV